MGFYAEQIFPRFYDVIVDHKFYNLRRDRLLKKAKGRVLEIGIGTGINLDFYPPSIERISAIDPNPGMRAVLEEKLKAKPRAPKVDFVLARAEELPFEDAAFDTVVSTIAMCSIGDLNRALLEIKRVLKPGGQFIFIEHGLSRDRVTASVQKILNPMQKLVCCGCSLTVDVEKALSEAEFQVQSMKLRYVKKSPKFIGHLYEGVAVV